MSYIYFQADDVQFVMDSYTDGSAPLDAQLSSSPMLDGTSQSDNYIVGTPKVILSGIISDVKTANTKDKKNTGVWIDKIYSIMNNKQSVLLQHRVDIEPTDGWFITSFTPSQNQTYGVGAKKADGSFIQSFQVSIHFERPILAKGLTTTVQPPKAYLDAMQIKGGKAATTSQFDEEDTKQELQSVLSRKRADEHYKNAAIGLSNITTQN